MTTNPAGLAGVPVGPLATHVWLRHCYLPAGGNPDPLYVNAADDSRWHTDEGTLYVAEDPVTVWAELCRAKADKVDEADPTGGVGLNEGNLALLAAQALGPPLPARSLYSVTVALDHVADVTTGDARDALQAAGIADPNADLIADDYGHCPEIAKTGQALGWQAVRAPSAARPGRIALAIFHDWWPAPGEWTQQMLAAWPTVAIAYLTRYKAGQRPAWVGPPPP